MDTVILWLPHVPCRMNMLLCVWAKTMFVCNMDGGRK